MFVARERNLGDVLQQGGGATSEVLDPRSGGPNALRDVMGPKTAQDMTFDGEKLRLYEPQLTSDATMTRNRPLLAEFDAVSGRSGYQGPEFQSLANNGPIPAGDYLVKQSDLQLRVDAGLMDRALSYVGRGSWPGGEISWGDSRVWLTPAAGTETFGRGGFSIHGGWYPGSAGCIDLTSSMPAFTQQFTRLGVDLNLQVRY